MTTYIRKADSDAVLLTNGYLKMVYGKGSPSAWKDLMICEIEPESIEKITMKHGQEDITLEQVPDDQDQAVEPTKVWKMTRPDRGLIQGPMIQRVTGMFRRLRAADFAEPMEDPAAYGFDESPTAIVTVKAAEEDEKVFIFGAQVDEKANQYYLKEQGKDVVYVVPKYRLESITKTPDEFFEEK